MSIKSGFWSLKCASYDKTNIKFSPGNVIRKYLTQEKHYEYKHRERNGGH